MPNKLGTKLVAHVEMMRPYTMFHAGMVALAGAAVASAGQGAPWRMALAALVTMCGWEAGLYAGDYYDREIDARSKPSRPVPSGRVSPREAFGTMVALIVVGYVAALALGWANLGLATLTTALGIAYSKTFKSRAVLGNFDRGVLGVCAVAFGALAVGGTWWPAVPLLAALVFFHDSATNLVGAIRDVDGDRAAGCPTVPVVYGMGRAVALVEALVVCWVAAAALLFVALRPGIWALILLGAALALALRVYVPLALRGAGVTRAQALGAHKYLVAERLILLAAVLATRLPAVVALGALTAALLLTLAAQALLRDRYERQQISRASWGEGYARP